MADFNSTSGGIMPEDTAGAGGIEDNDLWEGFFDEEETGTDNNDSGADGGGAGGEPEAGRETDEGGGQPAGQQGGPLPDMDAVVQPYSGYAAVGQQFAERTARQRVDAAIARQFGGMINPYTGRPITTEAELAAYHQAFAAEEQERRLRESGIDRNMLDEVISGHPVVQQANAMLHEQQQRQANDFMSQEFAALLQEFPDCGLKDPRDLMNTPEGMETLNLWQSGPISLKTAYAATHLNEIKAKQSKAVRQGVMNEVNGRAHLRQTNNGGQAGAEIPTDVDEAYQIYFPELTAAERNDLWKRTNG